MTKNPHQISQRNKIYDRIFAKILAYVSSRPRSKRDIYRALKKYLSKEDLSDEEYQIIENRIVDSLETYVTETDYDVAFKYVASFINSSRPRSRRYVNNYLMKKGLDSKDISRALENYTDDVELENIEKEILKLSKGSSYDEKDKRDYWNALLKKGYSSHLISQILL